MREQRVFAAAGVVLLLATASVTAELLDAPLEEKQAWSSHIVVGEVKQVYTSYRKVANGLTTNLVIALTVTAVEKGKGVKAGDVIYAPCWRAEKRSAVVTGTVVFHTSFSPVGPSGHREIPRPGDVVRIFLHRDATGAYAIFLPNGIEVVGASQSISSALTDSPRGSFWSQPLAPAMFFVVGVLSGYVCCRRKRIREAALAESSSAQPTLPGGGG